MTTKLRISSYTKEIIAFQVAKEWVTFAKRILKGGGRPAKLSKTAPKSIWIHLVNRYGEDAAETVSQRTIDHIAKLSRQQANLLITYGEKK
jgi:hypothetical protein